MLVPLTTDVRFSYSYVEEIDIIQRIDGVEDYTGDIVFISLYDDYYFGAGVSYNLSDRFTIGASAFISLKTLDYRFVVETKAMQNSDTVYSHGVPEAFYFA